MLAEIIAFYGFQFTDFFSTTLGLRMGASEANGIARPFVTKLPRFIIFKFGLSTFLLLFLLLSATDWLMVFHFSPMWVIYGDTVLEGVLVILHVNG